MAKEIAPELQNLMRQGGPLREQLEVQIYTGRATHEVHAIVELSDAIVALRRERDSFRQECARLRAEVDQLKLQLAAARLVDQERGVQLLRQAAQIVEMRVDAALKRDLLLWALYHAQGGSSPVGQPIRRHLGIEQHAHLTPEQIIDAARAAQGERT